MVDANTQPGVGLVAVVDIVFSIVGVSYASQILQPIPMTYLSEIAFPVDFMAKLISSIMLCGVHSLHWLLDMWGGPQWHQRTRVLSKSPVNSASHVFFEMLAWGIAATLLWMGHRRSQAPSLLLRAFWLFSWIHATIELFSHEHVTQLDLGADSSFVVAMAAIAYSCSALLGASCFFAATEVTSDLIDLPVVTTPSAFLHSTNFKFPLSGYGTFGKYANILSNSSAIARDTRPQHNDDNREDRNIMSQASNHSVSRGAVITATIPSSTASMWGKNHFISFKIVVQTEDDRWSVRRQYSDFASLHEELPDNVRNDCPLPEDESSRQYLSWKHRPTPLKTRLEKYLQRVLGHHDFEPYSSQALCDFLEMEYIDDSLLQSVLSAPPSGSSWLATAA